MYIYIYIYIYVLSIYLSIYIYIYICIYILCVIIAVSSSPSSSSSSSSLWVLSSLSLSLSLVLALLVVVVVVVVSLAHYDYYHVISCYVTLYCVIVVMNYIIVIWLQLILPYHITSYRSGARALITYTIKLQIYYTKYKLLSYHITDYLYYQISYYILWLAWGQGADKVAGLEVSGLCARTSSLRNG